MFLVRLLDYNHQVRVRPNGKPISILSLFPFAFFSFFFQIILALIARLVLLVCSDISIFKSPFEQNFISRCVQGWVRVVTGSGWSSCWCRDKPLLADTYSLSSVAYRSTVEWFNIFSNTLSGLRLLKDSLCSLRMSFLIFPSLSPGFFNMYWTHASMLCWSSFLLRCNSERGKLNTVGRKGRGIWLPGLSRCIGSHLPSCLDNLNVLVNSRYGNLILLENFSNSHFVT